LSEALGLLGKRTAAIEAERKGAPWKVAVAAVLKTKHGCTNGWISRHLRMGVECGVSRYVAEMAAGGRPEAGKAHRSLMSKIS